MAADDVVFTYIGKDGEYITGVPRGRDLTQHDYDRLEPILRANVSAAAFYEKVKSPKQTAAPKPSPEDSPDK